MSIRSTGEIEKTYKYRYSSKFSLSSSSLSLFIRNYTHSPTAMQFKFNVAFIAAALLTSASSVMSVKFTAYEGADCTGKVLGVSTGSKPGDCVFLAHGGSAKSIQYSGVPQQDQVHFFKSGGGNDKCTNGAILTRPGGSGCATAPAGVNLESVKYTK
ncbi:Membrane metallo-endopeptidase-like 1 [Mycena venus]|uniref:Membrane metallo-endopeptidase-like 1 n=1 Tax=Mycena venus TaxID=2733690 RepID=A0A8H6U3Z8_9AGAR|nr:Membrane metallo-endopeptidase-like 1 [Mycena venus]